MPEKNETVNRMKFIRKVFKRKRKPNVRVESAVIKEQGILDVLILMLLFIAGTYGCIYTFLSAYPFEFSDGAVVTLIIVFCVFYYLYYRFIFKWKLTMLFLAGGYAFIIFTAWDNLKTGFMQFANVLIDYINFYIGLNLDYFWMGAADGDYITLFLGMLLFFLTGVLGFVILYRRSMLIYFFTALLFVAGSLCLGEYPETKPVVALAMSFVGTQAMSINKKIFAKDAPEVKEYRSKIQIKAALIICCLCGLAFVAAHSFVAPRLEKLDKNMNEYAAKIRTQDYEGIWQKTPILRNYDFMFGAGKIATAGVGDGELGGVHGFFSANKDMLEVTVEGKPDETIYLKGYVGSIYTQKKWEQLPDSVYQDAGFNDFVTDFVTEYDPVYEYVYEEEDSAVFFSGKPETVTIVPYSDLKALIQNYTFDTIHVLDFLSMGGENSSSIKIKKIAEDARYLYTPYRANTYDYEDRMLYDAYIEGDNNQEYSLEYYTPGFVAELEEGSSYDLDYNNSIYTNYYRWFVDDKYLELPDQGLERLIEQCESQGIGTLEDIKNYIISTLSSAAAYNLNVGRTPDDKDFVEYFLYEKQEGYCVHFASAATLMFRIMGVPSRYVSGYIVTPSMFKSNGDGTYTAVVNSQKAHAWAEIFSEEDGGWTPVETTPGYITSMPVRNQNESDQRQTRESENQETRQSRESNDETRESGSRDRGNGQETSEIQEFIIYTVCVLAVIAVLILAVHMQRIIRRNKRLSKAGSKSSRKQVQHIFHSIIEMLEFDGLPSDISCITPEFLEEMSSRVPELSKEQIQALISLVYAANFGNDSLNTDNVSFVKDVYKEVGESVYKRLTFGGKVVFTYVKGFK